MKLKILIISVFFAFGFVVEEPMKLTWKFLTQVKFNKKLNIEVGEYFLYPTFGKNVLVLNGRQVSIKGYMIPIDVKSGLYVISANPMASCFFCGASGPESLIELNFKKKGLHFNTDDVRTIKGIFKTNEADIDHLNYIIDQAEVVR